MRAEVLGLHHRFEVQPAEREDGTAGPPYTLVMTVRPCWKKPARELHLVYLYESEDVVYYGMMESAHDR